MKKSNLFEHISDPDLKTIPLQYSKLSTTDEIERDLQDTFQSKLGLLPDHWMTNSLAH
jgi:hypothetical protein